MNKQAETNVSFGTNEICVAVFNNYHRNDTFYQIEVFTEKDVFIIDGDRSGGGKNDKKNNKIFFAAIGFAVGICLTFLVFVIVLSVKKRKNKLDFLSQESS